MAASTPPTVPPLANVITLGVRDLTKVRDFYHAFGWPLVVEMDDFYAFELRGAVLALFPLEKLAEDGQTIPTSDGDTLARGAGRARRRLGRVVPAVQRAARRWSPGTLWRGSRQERWDATEFRVLRAGTGANRAAKVAWPGGLQDAVAGSRRVSAAGSAPARTRAASPQPPGGPAGLRTRQSPGGDGNSAVPAPTAPVE